MLFAICSTQFCKFLLYEYAKYQKLANAFPLEWKRETEFELVWKHNMQYGEDIKNCTTESPPGKQKQ